MSWSDSVLRINEWAEEAYPPPMFKSYKKWIKALANDFLQNNKYFPLNEANGKLEETYRKYHPDAIIDFEPRRTKKAEFRNKIELMEMEVEFTPAQFAKSGGFNKNTTRREFQELTRKGILERRRKGVYRLKVI